MPPTPLNEGLQGQSTNAAPLFPITFVCSTCAYPLLLQQANDFPVPKRQKNSVKRGGLMAVKVVVGHGNSVGDNCSHSCICAVTEINTNICCCDLAEITVGPSGTPLTANRGTQEWARWDGCCDSLDVCGQTLCFPESLRMNADASWAASDGCCSFLSASRRMQTFLGHLGADYLFTRGLWMDDITSWRHVGCVSKILQWESKQALTLILSVSTTPVCLHKVGQPASAMRRGVGDQQLHNAQGDRPPVKAFGIGGVPANTGPQTAPAPMPSALWAAGSADSPRPAGIPPRNPHSNWSGS